MGTKIGEKTIILDVFKATHCCEGCSFDSASMVDDVCCRIDCVEFGKDKESVIFKVKQITDGEQKTI